MNDQDIIALVERRARIIADERIEEMLEKRGKHLDPAAIDARLKSSRHEAADHLDRGLLLQKLAASGATNGQTAVYNSTTQHWEPSSTGVATIYCSMTNDNSQSLTTGVTAKAEFDTLEEETVSGMADVVNDRITVPQTGVYTVQTKIGHGAGATARRARIYVNGNATESIHQDDGGLNSFGTCFTLKLAANDYVEYFATHTTGGLTLHTTDGGSYFRVARVG